MSWNSPYPKIALGFSTAALLSSLIVWWFIDGQIYTECAYGPEYSFLDIDSVAITVLVLAVGSSILGAALALWYLIKFRGRVALTLLALNIVASPLMLLEVWHTGNTTDYAVLSEKK